MLEQGATVASIKEGLLFYRRHRENLEDEYIKTRLMENAIAMKRADIPQELIEIKRLTILIKRRVKDENKTM